ncbi:MAG: glycosyltransferase [Thermoanaerobaculia bacterium]|nr:glycosyltransferase [Thermoanaerobaculia bacterium]
MAEPAQVGGPLAALGSFASRSRSGLELLTVPGLDGAAFLCPRELVRIRPGLGAFLETWRLDPAVVGHLEVLEAERVRTLSALRRVEGRSRTGRASAEPVRRPTADELKFRRLAAERRRALRRQTLWNRLLEQDRLWQRRRRQTEEVRRRILTASGWLEGLSQSLDEILGSWRWRVGHLLVHDIAKRALRSHNLGGHWAPHHARPIVLRFAAWRDHEGRRLRERLPEERDDLPLPVRQSPRSELSRAAEANARRCEALGARLAGQKKELHRLLQWCEQLASDLDEIVASWRWRVGHFLCGGAIGVEGRAGRAVRRLRAIAADLGRSAVWADQDYSADRPHDMRLVTEDERRTRTEELLAEPQEELVSIIMPTWNRASVLERAIATVRAQSYRNWELLVIDDGSADDTPRRVARLVREEPAIRYLRIDHQGTSRARNTGLEEARGEIVAYLDSDNEWDHDYLLFMVHALRVSGRSSAYAGQRIIREGRLPGSRVRARTFHLRSLLKNNYIDLNVFVHRREVLERTGGFDIELRRWVDWDLILRIVREEPPAQVPLVLGTYHVSSELQQITSDEPAVYKLIVLDKHLIDWAGLASSLGERRRGLASIVIPVHNQSRLTRECLESLFTTSAGFPFEVVVVDNASTDGTATLLTQLERTHDNLRRVETYENYGFGLACNLGVAASRGEYVVLLNNDTTVTPGWLGALIEPLAQRPEVGATGPKLLYPDGTLQSGGMVFCRQSAIPYNLYRGWRGDHPAVNRRRSFQALTGACLALRASDWVELRGFDCLYLNGCEDIDLCLRLASRSGQEILYVPESVIVHHESKTRGRDRHIRHNRAVLAERHGDSIEADDERYLREDGFEVVSYRKPGREPHGRTAVYYPELRTRDGQKVPLLVPKSRRRRRRVGFVSIWHARGVSFVTHQLAEALEEGRFETHIYAREESRRFRNAEPVRHPRVLDAGDDPPPSDIVEWARTRSLDLVVFVEVHPRDWKRVEALREAGVRVMAYEHLDILRRDLFERYGRFDAFLFSSFYAARVFQDRFSTPGLLVPWGVRPESVAPIQTKEGSQSDGLVRFVHVAGWGGLNRRKNSGLAALAFDAADLDNAELDFFTQAPLSTYGSRAARTLERNPRIRVRQGTIPDIFEAYRGGDVLLAPSKREGLGLPLLEALASGLPVVTSEGYLMKQWLIDGEHGVVCPAKPVPGPMYLPEVAVGKVELTAALRRLADDRHELGRMRRNVARDRELWLWTWQKQLLAEQLRQMLSDPDYRPAVDFSYLPERILAFERLRLDRERRLRGPVGPG